MNEYGIVVSRDGKDARDPITEATKKDFSFLSGEDSAKVVYAGFLEGQGFFQEIEYTHNLGKVPLFFLFYVDSMTNPTFYQLRRGGATTTKIFEAYIQYAYLIVLDKGA